MNLTNEDYKCLWWKLFNSVDAGTWANILGLVELLFCLPVANGRVERMFSRLRIIKPDSRTSLSKDRLDSLLRISEGPSVDAWQVGRAIKLWWSEKTRRQVGDARQLRRASRKPGEEDPDVSEESDGCCDSLFANLDQLFS